MLLHDGPLRQLLVWVSWDELKSLVAKRGRERERDERERERENGMREKERE